MQSEPEAALAVRAARSFVGDAAANAAMATAAARGCVASAPLVTLFVPNLDSDLEAPGPQLGTAPNRAPGAALLLGPRVRAAPLAPSPLAPSRASFERLPAAAPPVNKWVPKDAVAVVRPLMERGRIGEASAV